MLSPHSAFLVRDNVFLAGNTGGYEKSLPATSAAFSRLLRLSRNVQQNDNVDNVASFTRYAVSKGVRSMTYEGVRD